MYRIKIDKPLISVETDRFKDQVLSIRFFYPNVEPQVTLSNLLSYMMSDQSQNYPNKKQFHQRCDELYGLSVDVRTSSLGLHHSLELRMRTLNQVFMKDVAPNEFFEMFKEMIYQPLLSEAVFKEAYLNYQNALLRSQDKPQTLGLMLALKQLGDHLPISTHSQGSLDQLTQLTLEDVRTFYTHLFNQVSLVFYHGFKLSKQNRKALMTIHPQSQALKGGAYAFKSQDFRHIKIKKSITQTTLTQVYATSMDYHHPDYISLRLMSIMLGSMPNSLLFQEVREKRSLCYSIHATLLHFDGILIIQTGISKTQLNLVEELISKQIQRLSQRCITQTLLLNAKRMLISSLKSMSDDPYSSMSFLVQRTHESMDTDLNTLFKQIRAVSLDDVALAAQKLDLIAKSLIEGEQ